MRIKERGGKRMEWGRNKKKTISEWREKRKTDLSFAQRRGKRREEVRLKEKKKKKAGCLVRVVRCAERISPPPVDRGKSIKPAF